MQRQIAKDGFLNVRKPQGVSSHKCVQVVRKIFQTRQVGHGGTLDPMATGVLTMALGKATKFLQVGAVFDKLALSTPAYFRVAARANSNAICGVFVSQMVVFDVRQGIQWRDPLWGDDQHRRHHWVGRSLCSSTSSAVERR